MSQNDELTVFTCFIYETALICLQTAFVCEDFNISFGFKFKTNLQLFFTYFITLLKRHKEQWWTFRVFSLS